MARVKLVAGDWSEDGHKETTTYIMECNRTPEQIMAAFNRGCATIGVEVQNGWWPPIKAALKNSFEKYASAVPEDKLIKYFNLPEGIRFGPYIDHSLFGEEFAPNIRGCVALYNAGNDDFEFPFIWLWQEIVLIGDPDITFVEVRDETPSIPIGGYGLYEI
jgi:hypothetical protein